jgi:predicted NACHT family NTPase
MKDLPIKDLIKQPLTKLVDSLIKEFRQVAFNRILEYQLSEYKACLSTKTLLHRNKSANLMDIYCPLILSEKNKHLDNFGMFNNADRKFKIDSFHNAIDLLEQVQFIYLSGVAGAGKTTLIKYFLIASVKQNFKIPIRIDLRDLNDFEIKNAKANIFFTYIQDKIFRFNNLTMDEDITDRLLLQGSFVFLLDGFDELNANLIRMVNEGLEKFCTKYDKNNFVLTSRPFTQTSSPVQFVNLWINELDPDSVRLFVRNQRFDKKFESELLSTIDEASDNDYVELLKNPLLLSMFILTYRQYPNIPSKKHLYYQQVFEALFSIHDSVTKKGYKRQITCALPRDEFESVLNTFSFISYFGQLFKFDQEFLKRTLKDINQSKVVAKFNEEDYIYDLVTSTSLLIKESGEYTFIHRSMQEYFAALYLKSISSESKRTIFKNIAEDMVDSKTTFINEFFNLYSLIRDIDAMDCILLFELPLIEHLQKLTPEIRTVTSFHGNFFNKIGLFKFVLDAEKAISVRLGGSATEKVIEAKVGKSEWRPITFFLAKAHDDRSLLLEKLRSAETRMVTIVKGRTK